VLLPTPIASKSDAPAGVDCRLRLRDSGIAQLFLTFDSIRLYPRIDSIPIEVLTSPVTVDAMQLADTLGALLTSASVPAGDYSHLALRIPAASAVTDSGVTVTVVPACPDSLLRVLSRFSVVQGQAVEIQIRVDLDRSVREVPPGSGHYILMPVISGTLHLPGGGHRGGPGGQCPGGPGPGSRHHP
jgi:hypothetical protein